MLRQCFGVIIVKFQPEVQLVELLLALTWVDELG